MDKRVIISVAFLMALFLVFVWAFSGPKFAPGDCLESVIENDFGDKDVTNMIIRRVGKERYEYGYLWKEMKAMSPEPFTVRIKYADKDYEKVECPADLKEYRFYEEFYGKQEE